MSQLCYRVSGHNTLNRLISSCTKKIGGRNRTVRSPPADFRSIQRGCYASFHWQSPTAATGGGKAPRGRREKSSTREMGAAASKTGNTDYDMTHLGTIHTETQLSQGANTWGTRRVGNVERKLMRSSGSKSLSVGTEKKKWTVLVFLEIWETWSKIKPAKSRNSHHFVLPERSTNHLISISWSMFNLPQVYLRT